MDQRIMAAAYSGDINILHQLLQQNPFILSDHSLSKPHENPLTIATKANQLFFIREALKLRPELAKEPNQDGLRPLDVASAYGNLEIVRELLWAAGPEICRLAGRDGMTAVHYAAQNGNVEIIGELMKACPECGKDVTYYGESALHLAVKCYKIEALGCMLQWLAKGGMVEVVNLGDREGNTVLHCAVARKQLVSVELLLDWNKKAANNTLDLNAVNKRSLTAADIIDIFIESSNDLQLRDLLHRASSYTSSQVQLTSDEPEAKPEPKTKPIDSIRRPAQKPKNWEDILKYFEFQWQRDSPGEARETLLLVAALIATVTFQAGITPPSYLSEPFDVNITGGEIQTRRAERSMVSITVFLVANSIALSTAVSIVDYLTIGLPFQRELRLSISAMIFAYGWSLGNTKPTGRVKTVLLVVAICMPLFLRVLPYMMTKYRKRQSGDYV